MAMLGGSSAKIKITHFVPYNGKIADITHADTSKHTLDLATALSETRTIIGINVRGTRISGTGSFIIYPNEGTSGWYASSTSEKPFVLIASGTDRLEYALSVANDDWDLYCFGYIVEV